MPKISRMCFRRLLEVMDDLYDDFLYEYENATLCGE